MIYTDSRRGKPITEAEIAFIGANYRTMSDEEMADELRRTVSAVEKIRHLNKWKRRSTPPKGARNSDYTARIYQGDPICGAEPPRCPLANVDSYDIVQHWTAARERAQGVAETWMLAAMMARGLA